jgi:enoyl-CoA hydratase
MSDHLSDTLELTRCGEVLTVTLNRPEHLNAADGSLHTALSQVWGAIATDDSVAAVILTGAGSAFSAGGDFDWMASYQHDPSYRARVADEIRLIICGMTALPQPLIAAVNGPAVGLGASLAVSCDIVLLSDRAFLADPHVGVGLVCGDGGAAMWPLLTSLLQAKQYLFTGDRIPPDVAVQLGLANQVVAHDDLTNVARHLAERLAVAPRQALRDTKRALNLHLHRALAGIMDFAIAAEFASMGSDDHRAMVDALRQRRDTH